MNGQKILDRKQIFLAWLFGSIVLMLVAAVLSMVIWNFVYQAESDTAWQPINHLLGMVYFVPVGWLLSFINPLGWISLLFMCFSLYKISPKLLLGSAVMSVALGGWWPMTYVKMMGLAGSG
ncbi:MAG: hypothetical protein H8E79_07000 [Desulfobulbaceae bacterium]|uniref:Uncharacterized protein n=1 Tax=Candidatus Desulfatifera sulfidica TaxID=2841691 RepID=A0A8J6T9T7_9BACT|nr:hypothetical protein [Candidatus Desulfatifera sulfidica]